MILLKFFKYIILLASFVLSYNIKAQNVSLAINYVEQGEYEKAKTVYEKLYKSNSNKQDYLLGLADVFVQLEEFEMAANLLKDYLERPGNYPNILVELGHIYQIQNDTVEAKSWYEKAVNQVEERSVFAYSTGRAFEKHSLVDYAIETYKIANADQPRANYSIQLARLYGEKGDVQSMFDSYISLLEQNVNYFDAIQRNLTDYINSNPQNESNLIFKRLLLKKLQKSPKLLYNQILSWVFVQEDSYKNAFTQEKAIFKRSEFKDFARLFDLAQVSVEAEAYNDALEIFDFIKDESQNYIIQLRAIEKELRTRLLIGEDIALIEKKFEEYLNNYGVNKRTIELQILYAEFLAFQKENYSEALSYLQNSLNVEVNQFQKAALNLLLADIYVAQGFYNKALIKYSLVSKQVKNTPMAQTAKFKTAMTSYYKGDFDWALTQLNVLKKATTQTIANDALEMALFIKQGKSEIDSTQQALKGMAKADLLIYQSKPDEALVQLDRLIENSENFQIIDQALYKKSQVLEDLENYEEAATNYQQIIAQYPESIVVDNALFALSKLYIQKLNKPELASQYLEDLIFNHQDSIFFVEGRKMYRKLRQKSNT